jgi:hypothetical protein
MKIVYIAKFDKMWNEEGIALALERNGVKVVRLEDSGYPNRQYLNIIDKEKPDYVMFAKANTQESGRKLIETLKFKGYKTISWTFDLYLGYPSRQDLSRFNFFDCDFVFLTDGGHIKDYRDRRINAFLLRQGIPAEYNYLSMKDDKYDYDVVFVGCANKFWPSRQRMLNALQNIYGNRFHWYGILDTNEIRGHELNKLYSTAKIVIGDSVYAENYWSNRIYEVIGRGGFVIQAVIPGLNNEFVPDKEYVPYDFGNYAELKKKIDYYLSNNDEREKIRLAGFDRVKNNYTFDHRIKEMLSIISYGKNN